MLLVLWIEVFGLTRLDSSTLYSFLCLLNVTWLTMALWSLFTGEQVSSYLYWQLIFVTYLTHLFICSYRFTFHYFYFLCFGLFFCCVSARYHSVTVLSFILRSYPYVLLSIMDAQNFSKPLRKTLYFQCCSFQNYKWNVKLPCYFMMTVIRLV